MPEPSVVANPGSTLGEAVGALVEKEVNRLMRPIAEENGCVYVTAGRPDPRTGRATKLLLQNDSGNRFGADAVIATPRMQPLILIKPVCVPLMQSASALCRSIVLAHDSLCRVYPSVRQSIAVFIESFKSPSPLLVPSSGVTLFAVDTPRLVSLLAEYDIAFDGNEQQRQSAESWQRWQALSETDYEIIAQRLLADFAPDLHDTLLTTLSRQTLCIEASLLRQSQ